MCQVLVFRHVTAAQEELKPYAGKSYNVVAIEDGDMEVTFEAYSFADKVPITS